MTQPTPQPHSLTQVKQDVLKEYLAQWSDLQLWDVYFKVTRSHAYLKGAERFVQNHRYRSELIKELASGLAANDDTLNQVADKNHSSVEQLDATASNRQLSPKLIAMLKRNAAGVDHRYSNVALPTAAQLDESARRLVAPIQGPQPSRLTPDRLPGSTGDPRRERMERANADRRRLLDVDESPRERVNGERVWEPEPPQRTREDLIAQLEEQRAREVSALGARIEDIDAQLGILLSAAEQAQSLLPSGPPREPVAAAAALRARHATGAPRPADQSQSPARRGASNNTQTQGQGPTK